jgi:hypothetical protein
MLDSERLAVNIRPILTIQPIEIINLILPKPLTVSGDLKLLSGGQAENVSVSLSVFFLKI